MENYGIKLTVSSTKRLLMWNYSHHRLVNIYY